MNVFVPGGGVRIAAMGSYLPARVVTNDDLIARGAPMSAAEIERLCGVVERRYARDDEATSDLAIAAASQAVSRAQIDRARVARVVLATVSPDYSSPAAACLVQAGLGLRGCPAHDITAACCGFLYGLDVAARCVLTGDSVVLLTAADIRSRYLDVTDRATCALFGDGAGAAVVTSGPPGVGLLAIATVADGTGARSVYVPAGGSRTPASQDTVAARMHAIRMDDGPQVYLSAVDGMLAVGELVLDALGLCFSDIDLIIPHQANLRIIRRLARLARVSEHKVMINIERVGNISGATIPVALDRALTTGRVRAGDRVLLLAAGAGHTAGAAVYAIDEALVASSQR